MFLAGFVFFAMQVRKDGTDEKGEDSEDVFFSFYIKITKFMRKFRLKLAEFFVDKKRGFMLKYAQQTQGRRVVDGKALSEKCRLVRDTKRQTR